MSNNSLLDVDDVLNGLEPITKRLRFADEEATALWQALITVQGQLLEISDYAHLHSTGPTKMDSLWCLKEMVNDCLDVVDVALA